MRPGGVECRVAMMVMGDLSFFTLFDLYLTLYYVINIFLSQIFQELPHNLVMPTFTEPRSTSLQPDLLRQQRDTHKLAPNFHVVLALFSALRS